MLLIIVFVTFLFLLMLIVTSFFMKKESTSTREVFSPFECGFDSSYLGRVPFSLRFFVFLLLFLVFDVELVLFFHFPMGGTFNFIYIFSLMVVYLGFILDEEFMGWGILGFMKSFLIF